MRSLVDAYAETSWCTVLFVSMVHDVLQFVRNCSVTSAAVL